MMATQKQMDQALARLIAKLSKPETLAVLQRMKDR
jgi:hypothetical protein